MADTGLLTELAAEADAFVHSVGLLLDRESGLGGVNFITSGSRSVPAEGATYDTVMRDSAAALAAAARSGATGGAERPLVYVSAAEAAWCESEGGQKLEAALPEFLGRYLSAKREAEALLQASSGLRVVLARPSLMYDWSKLDVLPLLPIVNPASALGERYGGGLGLLSKMLRVHVVGAAVVAALEAAEARGAKPICPHLPISPCISLHLPTSHHISLHLPRRAARGRSARRPSSRSRGRAALTSRCRLAIP